MWPLRIAVGLLVGAAFVPAAFPQAEYRVYNEHPRLFLDAARLSRLKKEVARNSLRWQTLTRLIPLDGRFPEKPLLDALLYRLEGNEKALESARAWSRELAAAGIGGAADLRHAALVYDWSHDALGSQEQALLRGAVVEALEALLPQANLDVGLIRAGILAALALAGDWEGSEPALEQLIEAHWKSDVEQALRQGGLVDDGAALIAVLEVCHAVRHNLDINLWRRTPSAFQSLARTRLLSYYPFDIETPEGRTRMPAIFRDDAARAGVEAPLYRIAEMLLVAYEANSREFQFLQGWIRNDRYTLRSLPAALYEFLWVNPYLPGLTPQSSPLLAYDEVRGRLFARNSWENTALWIGYTNGRLELLAEGRSTIVSAAKRQAPLMFPHAAVVPIGAPAKVTLAAPEGPGDSLSDGKVYLIGLNPAETYAVKINNRRAVLREADSGGILVIFNDPNSSKRNTINFAKKLRIEVKPTLKPTRPGRARPSLAR